LFIFCLLWVPVFYIFRRAVVGESATAGSIWALVLGSITAIVQFFLGDFIIAGGFGLNRWLHGFIDLICVQTLLPFLVYIVLLVFRRFKGDIDFASFTLLWLIPTGCIRAVSWSGLNNPVLLIFVPLLWTALAVGISFLINWMIKERKWYKFVISVPCILIMPFITSAAYWALFSQNTILGFGLLFAAHVPLILSFIFERHHE